jgi:hypothetical protein
MTMNIPEACGEPYPDDNEGREFCGRDVNHTGPHESFRSGVVWGSPPAADLFTINPELVEAASRFNAALAEASVALSVWANGLVAEMSRGLEQFAAVYAAHAARNAQRGNDGES